MYVCVCRAVSDSKIRRAVEQGACSMRALKDQLGRCVPEARQMIRDCRAEQPVMRLDQLPAQMPGLSAAAA